MSGKTTNLTHTQTLAADRIRRLLIQFWIDNDFFGGYGGTRFTGRVTADRICNGTQIDWWSYPLCEDLTPKAKWAITGTLEEQIKVVLKQYDLFAVRFETEWHRGRYLELFFEERDYLWIPWTLPDQAQEALNSLPPPDQTVSKRTDSTYIDERE